MLHGGNHTWWDNLFTIHSGWNQYPLVVLLGRSKSLLWCPLVVVSLQQFSSGCWDVSVTWTLKHLFGLQFLRLVTLMNLSSAEENSGSSFPVAVLMRASFIIALDGFCECTWRNFYSSWNFDWPSCLKVMMDCHFSLLIWAVSEIIWTWSFTK